MNTKIFTKEAIRSLGINVSDQMEEELVEQANDKLAERIGETFLATLTDDEMEYYDKLRESGKIQEASDYLISHVDDPEQRMKDEIDIIMGELAESYETINNHED